MWRGLPGGLSDESSGRGHWRQGSPRRAEDSFRFLIKHETLDWALGRQPIMGEAT